MINTPWKRSVYIRLLHLSRQGFLQAHAAYLAAGLLALFGVKPAGLQAKPVSLKALLGGLFVLLALFALSAPILNAMQPVFRAAGQLDGGVLCALVAVVFLGWRHAIGRRLLRAFEQAQGA